MTHLPGLHPADAPGVGQVTCATSDDSVFATRPRLYKKRTKVRLCTGATDDLSGVQGRHGTSVPLTIPKEDVLDPTEFTQNLSEGQGFPSPYGPDCWSSFSINSSNLSGSIALSGPSKTESAASEEGSDLFSGGLKWQGHLWISPRTGDQVRHQLSGLGCTLWGYHHRRTVVRTGVFSPHQLS